MPSQADSVMLRTNEVKQTTVRRLKRKGLMRTDMHTIYDLTSQADNPESLDIQQSIHTQNEADFWDMVFEIDPQDSDAVEVEQ